MAFSSIRTDYVPITSHLFWMLCLFLIHFIVCKLNEDLDLQGTLQIFQGKMSILGSFEVRQSQSDREVRGLMPKNRRRPFHGSITRHRPGLCVAPPPKMFKASKRSRILSQASDVSPKSPSHQFWASSTRRRWMPILSFLQVRHRATY
jgi:hypothetical protein